MDLVKRNCRVLVMSLIPQGGKPKDAIELVFKTMYVEPVVTTTFLREGYSVTMTMEDRDILVEDSKYNECCGDYAPGSKLMQAQSTTVRKPAPKRKPTPKKAPAPEPQEEVLELTPPPAPKSRSKKTIAKSSPYDKEAADPEEIIIED